MVVSLQGYPARKLQLQHVSHKGKLTRGLVTGTSPGFFIPPKEKVPDAEKYVDEPGSTKGVRIRVIRNAVLVEMSLVSRPSYTETGLDVRGFDMYEEPAKKKRVKRWL